MLQNWIRVVGPALLALAWLVTHSYADEVKLDKPVRVLTYKPDKTKVAGRVASYSDASFDLLDEAGKSQTLKWADVGPKAAMEIYTVLLVKGTVDDWITAGNVLYKLEEGKVFGDRAFDRALRLDPAGKKKIEAARAAAVASIPPPSSAAILDKPNNPYWGRLTDEVQAASVKELKQFAENTRWGKAGTIKLIETKYFLFYSDLKPQEAQNWASLLDKMYARLSELFGVPKDTNLWRGKALVIVFSKQEDYYALQREAYKTDGTGTAGMCHNFGNGYDHIAFYRQPQDLDFAHVLVHESVHGFIHRYRSDVHVPSWANEGLAEVIAYELVPQRPMQTMRKSMTVEYLAQRGVGGDFFTTEHIAAWQYPVAENMCSFMIAQNKKAYVSFINGIKDGLSAEESLEKNYGGVKTDRLVAAFKDSMGVKARN